MRQQLPAAVLTMAAVLVMVGVSAACNVTQPPLGCPVQRTTWAARYTLVEGQDASLACAGKGGERLGIQTYNVPDTNQNTLVIKPDTLAKLDDQDSAHPPYSLGAWPDQAGADSFCVAPTLSVAEKHVPASGGAPARDVAYRWSNVRIVAEADAPGSQMIAELAYTEGDCTARYEVWGVWPAVACADGDGAPDDSFCTEPGHSTNPDFALTCDRTQLRCVPAKRPPSFRK